MLRLVDTLVAEGVARYSADETDRRKQRLKLMEAGVATFEQMEAYLDEWADQLMVQISGREFAQVSEALERIWLVVGADRDYTGRKEG